MTFTASKQGFFNDMVETTISEETSKVYISISLAPYLVDLPHHMRLVMNWGSTPLDLDLHSVQINK